MADNEVELVKGRQDLPAGLDLVTVNAKAQSRLRLHIKKRVANAV
jgi:hypothetical protein